MLLLGPQTPQQQLHSRTAQSLTHHEVLAQLNIQQTGQQLPAVQGCILAVRAVPVKHAEQVAASHAAKVTDLDEELVLVLTLEGPKPNVLQASSLHTRHHSRRRAAESQAGQQGMQTGKISDALLA